MKAIKSKGKALESLLEAIRNNVNGGGYIKLQYIADELEELGYFDETIAHAEERV
jgi:hypothetical protein